MIKINHKSIRFINLLEPELNINKTQIIQHKKASEKPKQLPILFSQHFNHNLSKLKKRLDHQMK